MSKLFTHSRKSIRLQNWNYSWKGLYFVTVKTRLGANYFGEIVNGQMVLSDIGKEVEKQWMNTPVLRWDMNLKIDEYVVMPNHFHGIIGIGKNEFNHFTSNAVSIKNILHEVKLPGTFSPLYNTNSKNSFGPQRKNLASIMRGFKSSVTSWCRSNHKLFDWQSRFYDVLIRDESQLIKIRHYIRNNPKKWHRDRFNPNK